MKFMINNTATSSMLYIALCCSAGGSFAQTCDSLTLSSNLQIAIDKALKMSSNLSELWVSGDLPQKKKIQNLVFPSGIGYDKSNGKVRTHRVNSIFSAIPLLSRDLAKIKSGEPVDFNQFSARVTL